MKVVGGSHQHIETSYNYNGDKKNIHRILPAEEDHKRHNYCRDREYEKLVECYPVFHRRGFKHPFGDLMFLSHYLAPPLIPLSVSLTEAFLSSSVSEQ